MIAHLRKGLALLWLVSLTACSDDTASLNITGVDYAGQGIRYYYVVDPTDDKNRGGGESITPYSAGGIMCCYSVPKKWQEGLSVDVVVSYPLEGDTTDERSASLAKREAEGKLNETIHVEVPKYETPAKGTLWVQFLPDKQANVVVSNLSPDHKDFPGEVKGWPVPSDEYRKKIADREIKDASSRVAATKKDLDAIRAGDESVVKDYWRIRKKTAPDEIAKFSGWSDPRFLKYLEKSLEWYVERDEKNIEDLKRVYQ
ncbi:hypothetical protein GY26_05495 [Gammaproteobacteria bacterium MFB021]|nr:hypothetical protein GY26_05495 [Gammaproteobacteria bacterium MFB021]